MAVFISPPLPHPATARPTRNAPKVDATAEMNRPIASNVLERTTKTRGVKISENRPVKGVTLDMAIFKGESSIPFKVTVYHTIYAEVNQVVSAKASKSAAMADCAVVIIDMFVAVEASSEFNALRGIKRT